jgi:hypothetical protein
MTWPIPLSPWFVSPISYSVILSYVLIKHIGIQWPCRLVSCERINIAFSIWKFDCKFVYLLPRFVLAFPETWYCCIGLLTCYEVALVIGQQKLIPIWKILEVKSENFQTPSGALLLQWIVSVIMIAATPYSQSGFAVMTTLYTYGHTFFVCEYCSNLTSSTL